MATIDNNLALSANAFAKCAPNIKTNLAQCGSVGLCNAQVLTVDDLEGVYTKSGEYRVMEHLLRTQMEIKMCEATQNGLYDFLMANKVNMRRRVVPMGRDTGLLEIAPFINAKQYSPINNEYWLFNSGAVSGDNRYIEVHSAGNVPLDVRSFPSEANGKGIIVYLNSAGDGGAVSRTAWKVMTATLAGDVIALTLSSLNSESNLDSSKVDLTPTSGYLTRGGNNVNDYERECQEKPSYMNHKRVQFWVKTRRWSLCSSTRYNQWRALMLSSNILFREDGDVPDVERNRQLAMEFQKSYVQDFFWGKPLPNQNAASYDQLETIESYDGGDSNLGVDGDVCVGRRAEPVGVYEQLAECDRVVDLLGDQLNLIALFHAFYDIIRIRSSQGDNNKIIDVFTDTTTAELINRAMMKYYSARAEDHNGEAMLRINSDAGPFGIAKRAEFGFLYRSYHLHWPAGVVMNVLTHYAFDDEITVATDAGIGDTARRLWILDFKGIYPGIIATNRVVAKTGDLRAMAGMNPDWACVMKVHSREQTLNSQTDTTIVECPAGNLILENFNSEIPDYTEIEGLRYGSATTTTTTTPA